MKIFSYNVIYSTAGQVTDGGLEDGAGQASLGWVAGDCCLGEKPKRPISQWSVQSQSGRPLYSSAQTKPSPNYKQRIETDDIVERVALFSVPDWEV